MIDDWFSTVELPLTWEQLHRLPQNPAYKYEYFDGRAWLTPQPKSYHALLDLRSFARPIATIEAPEEIGLRPFVEDDWQQLPPVLAAAFSRVQPFAGLSKEGRVQAAHECLSRTREGGEGPVITEACAVAACKSDGALIGAMLTTLMPDGDPADWDAWRWHTSPPVDAIRRGMGRPHLTWVYPSAKAVWRNSLPS